MASYSDQQLLAAAQPHLQPGEQVRSIAYGTKGLATWATIVCVILILASWLIGLIIYLIWHYATLQHFLLVLTDRRILVVQVKGLAPVATWEYALPYQGHITSAQNGFLANKGVQIELNAAPRPFSARFLNVSGPTNMMNAQNIAQAIGQSRMEAGGAGAGAPMGMPQLGGAPAQLPAPGAGGWGAAPGEAPGGYGAPGSAPGGYGAPQGSGYGPPPGGAPQGGGYGPPPGGAPQGGGYGPPGSGPGGYGGPGQGQGGPGQGGQGGWGQG